MKTKYDCTKTSDFAHEAKRMCRCYIDDSNCAGCPLYAYDCDIDKINDRMIDVVQKWSDEHPKLEYMRWFATNGIDSNVGKGYIPSEYTECRSEYVGLMVDITDWDGDFISTYKTYESLCEREQLHPTAWTNIRAMETFLKFSKEKEELYMRLERR